MSSFAQNPPLDTESSYGYPSPDGLRDAGPTFWICVLFITLYGISVLLHVGQAIYWRKWFLFPTIVLGGLGEIAGWSGRLWGSKNPMADTPYTIQITTTIIAPTFLSAASFIILGRIVTLSKGEIYSRLTPRRYTRVFLTTDVFALVTQAAGGGIASGSNNSSAKLGANIMLGGILLQLFALIIFAIVGCEFVYRIHTNRPLASRIKGMAQLTNRDLELRDQSASTTGLSSDAEKYSESGVISRDIQKMIYGLAFSTLLLFIRGIYRTCELADGWNGTVIQTEAYFNWLDGGMITLWMFTMNYFHPGQLLRV